MLNFIIWDVSPEIFSFGERSVRWYGLFFALAFVIGSIILYRIYRREGRSEKDVDTITIYMLISTVIGARLGHCLFYGWEYYLENPIEILYIWEGGLASHGAAFGILFGIWLYSRKHPDQSYLYLLDRIVITIAIAACFIRMGNLMNSEIIGKPTKDPFGFLFVHDSKKLLEEHLKSNVNSISFELNGKDTTVAGIHYAGVDAILNIQLFNPNNAGEFVQNAFIPALNNCSYCNDHLVSLNKGTYRMVHKGENSITIAVPIYGIPRHPTQLYEALTSLLLFGILLFLYYKTDSGFREGRLFAIFVIWIFGLRFAHEYFKENQEVFESGMQQSLGLNMGQLLSIPLIVAGVYILIRSFRKDLRQ